MIDPKDGSLNHQLANAVAAVARASDHLALMRDAADKARREEVRAINAVNEAQKHFDELVAEVKRTAPRETDWKRPKALPVESEGGTNG